MWPNIAYSLKYMIQAITYVFLTDRLTFHVLFFCILIQEVRKFPFPTSQKSLRHPSFYSRKALQHSLIPKASV